MVTVRGTVKVAYNPKVGSGKFFFQFEDADGKSYKSMGWLEWRGDVIKGAVIDFTGTPRGEWFNASSLEIVSKPVVEPVERTLEIGHVGMAKPTRFGLGSYAKVGDRWCTIPCRASRRYFDGDDGDGDVAFDFPHRGRGLLRAMVADDGDTMAVVEILAWTPASKHLVADLLASKVSRAFVWGGDLFEVPAHLCPPELPWLARHDMFVHVDAEFVKHSQGINHWVWAFESGTVTVNEAVRVEYERMTWSDKIASAIDAVRREMFRLLEVGVVVDDALVADLFLKQGVTSTAEQRNGLFSEGYDARYLEALVGLGERVWRIADGFVVKVGEWLAWERCVAGAATYIVPARSPKSAGADLTVEEWVAVLGRVLPECNKMQLRYGELGQMLTGTAEGARFAFHVEDDNGDFGGWLAAVKAATEHEPVVKQTVAFDLARVLALAAGD